MRRSRMIGMAFGWAACLAGVAGLSLAMPAAAQPAGQSTAVKTTNPGEDRAKAIWANLIETGDAAKAVADASAALKDAGTVNGPAADVISLARCWRLCTIVAGADSTARANAKAAKPDANEVKKRAMVIRDNPQFADALAWVFNPAVDNAKAMNEVIGQLAEAGAKFENYPGLAAAIVVVHDARNPRRQTWTMGPVDVYGFYAQAQGKPVFALQSLPPELLVHIVDSCVAQEEMLKARQRYGGRALIGKTYHDIRYDNNFFEHGRKKAIDGKPYTMETIQKYGGVCVEQAYFAEHASKSIGTPAVTVTAKGDDVGHAWVGYLRTQSNRYFWDLTEGRYKDYKGEAASFTDPQSWQPMTDAELQMKADRANSPRNSVMESIAVADAASLVTEDVQAMKLFERAVNACPSVCSVWDKVSQRAMSKKLQAGDVEKWGAAIVNLCGSKYPDFGLKILRPMIASLDTPLARAASWKWAREKLVESQRSQTFFRDDLAVELRLLEGDGWRDGGDMNAAWNAYRETIKRYGKETPAVKDAGERCEQLLVAGGKSPRDIAEFWKSAWQDTEEPRDMSREFAFTSNWSTFGLKYAQWLERAGDRSKAESVRKKILPEQRH